MFSLVYIFFIFLFLIQNVKNNDDNINACLTKDPYINKTDIQNVNQ